MRASVLRDTRLLVDLDLISHNLQELRAFLDETAPKGAMGPRIAAVLKADAYGLGAGRVALHLAARGVDLFAVACLSEAIELRRLLPDADILVMGHSPTGQFPELVENRIIATIFDERQAEALSRSALEAGTRARVHVKIDSGMNRLGIKTGPEALGTMLSIAGQSGLEVEGIFTHLALDSSDSDRLQVARFMALVAAAEIRGLRFRYRHVCDSIGLARYPEFHLDLVRPGAILWGVAPGKAPLLADRDFRLALSFRTRVSRLRAVGPGEGVGYDFTWKAPPEGALVATLPAGYADGYPRNLSNVGEVLIRGVRAPVVGLVCMDQLTVDASAVPGVAEGDEAILFGSDESGRIDSGIPLLEAASWASTNRNELIASISRRVPRVYRREGRDAGHVDYVLREDTIHD